MFNASDSWADYVLKAWPLLPLVPYMQHRQYCVPTQASLTDTYNCRVAEEKSCISISYKFGATSHISYEISSSLPYQCKK